MKRPKIEDYQEMDLSKGLYYFADVISIYDYFQALEQYCDEVERRNAKLEKRYKTLKDKNANKGREIAKLQKENEELRELLDAYIAVEEANPCDPDITDEQIEAYSHLSEVKNKQALKQK